MKRTIESAKLSVGEEPVVSVGYQSYYLFDPQERAHHLAKMLSSHGPFTVIDASTLRSDRPTKLTELATLYNLLSARLPLKGLAQLRIFAAPLPKWLDSLTTCALRSVPLAEFFSNSQARASMEPVDTSRLFSVFQPIFSLQDGSCLGHEALVRGRTKSGTLLGALRLLDHVESTGCIKQFDQSAQFIHLKTVNRLETASRIFLNFIPDTPRRTARKLPRLLDLMQGRRPLDQYVLEVTNIEHLEVSELRATLNLWREAGVSLALDDLSACVQPEWSLDLDLAFAKIDLSLIDHVDTDPHRQQLIYEIVKNAHDRSICVIAEGIEREAELNFCRKLGIEYGQGFLLGRPSEQICELPCKLLNNEGIAV